MLRARLELNHCNIDLGAEILGDLRRKKGPCSHYFENGRGWPLSKHCARIVLKIAVPDRFRCAVEGA